MRPPEALTAGPRFRLSDAGRALTRPIVVIVVAASALALAVYLVSGRSLIPLGAPFALGAAYVAAKQPPIAMGAVLLLTGFEGTITATTTIPVNETVNLLLAAVWLGVIGSYLGGMRDRSTWLWPGLMGLCLYLVLTLVAIFTSTSLGDAFDSFRTSAFFLATGVLIAVAPWSRRTYLLIARGMLLVALAVGAYALLRYIIGPSEAEETLARANATALRLPSTDELRFFGSFGIAGNLAAWTSVLVPLALSFTLGSRGRWRVVALLGLAFCSFGMLVSEIRTGLVAGAAGAIAVALLFAGARAFPGGRRLVGSLAAVLLIGVTGAVAYTLTIGTSPEATTRYERLVEDPSNDEAYAIRLKNWGAALDLAEKEPFGYGLGTQGAVGQSGTGLVGPTNLDSSYLKVAIEQGIFAMVFLIAALLVLLIGLASFAVRVTDRTSAMLAMAGAGALVSGMVLFYAGMFIEGIIAVPLWLIVGIGAAQPATRLRARSRAGYG